MLPRSILKALTLAATFFCSGSLSAFSIQHNALNLHADLLYWTARESGTENWAQVFDNASPDSTITILPVDFKWNAGLRVGADYALPCDCWDTRFYYTWFRTKGSDHASTDGLITSSFTGSFYINNTEGAHLGPSYRKAGIDWTINFNMFDWELGRKLQICNTLALRPFIGLKGGWIHQSVNTTWEDPIVANPASFGVSRENIKNNFFGIGPSIGMDGVWDLCRTERHTINIFGDISGALMYGHWSFSDIYTNEVPQRVEIDVPASDGAATMMRSFVGMGWETPLCDGNYIVQLRIGYEFQIWMDQLQFYSLNWGRLGNPLTLQGGTVDFQFKF